MSDPGRPGDPQVGELSTRLRTWPDPAARYHARRTLDGEDPASPSMRSLADAVRARPECVAVIERCDWRHPYRKWQGAHWALTTLAERGHPGGDPRLPEVQEAVFAWILGKRFLRPNWPRFIEGQPDRVRRCGSMEGNVARSTCWCPSGPVTAASRWSTGAPGGRTRSGPTARSRTGVPGAGPG